MAIRYRLEHPVISTFGSGDYHSTADFIPGGVNIHLGGRGCSGGAASYWYSTLVKTSGQVIIGSSFSYPADSNYYHDSGTKSASAGISYYGRWHGQNDSLQNGYSAPCAAVDFTW
jgi:hypothetical protein